MNMVCKYIVSLPSTAGQYDTFVFRLNKADRLTAYYMIGTSYSNSGINMTGTINIGEKMIIKFPQKIWVWFIATDIAFGVWNIQTWA